MEGPSFKKRSWIEFDQEYYRGNCQYFISKQKHQIDEVPGQEKKNSERLLYVNQK